MLNIRTVKMGCEKSFFVGPRNFRSASPISPHKQVGGVSMRSRFLTALQARRDHRRTAIWMSLGIAVMVQSMSARADEAAPTFSSASLPVSLPAPLMTRALHYNGYDPQRRSGASAAAQWMPALRVHATVERTPGRLGYNGTQLYGELAWPLGRTPAGDSVAEEQSRRQTSAGRQRLLDHIAEVWRRRQHASDHKDDLERRLAVEESQAELDVLTGDHERGP
jgi:hypothetical protein